MYGNTSTRPVKLYVPMVEFRDAGAQPADIILSISSGAPGRLGVGLFGRNEDSSSRQENEQPSDVE
jgi:hypothetical protein